MSDDMILESESGVSGGSARHSAPPPSHSGPGSRAPAPAGAAGGGARRCARQTPRRRLQRGAAAAARAQPPPDPKLVKWLTPPRAARLRTRQQGARSSGCRGLGWWRGWEGTCAAPRTATTETRRPMSGPSPSSSAASPAAKRSRTGGASAGWNRASGAACCGRRGEGSRTVMHCAQTACASRAHTRSVPPRGVAAIPCTGRTVTITLTGPTSTARRPCHSAWCASPARRCSSRSRTPSRSLRTAPAASSHARSSPSVSASTRTGHQKGHWNATSSLCRSARSIASAPSRPRPARVRARRAPRARRARRVVAFARALEQRPVGDDRGVGDRNFVCEAQAQRLAARLAPKHLDVRLLQHGGSERAREERREARRRGGAERDARREAREEVRSIGREGAEALLVAAHRASPQRGEVPRHRRRLCVPHRAVPHEAAVRAERVARTLLGRERRGVERGRRSPQRGRVDERDQHHALPLPVLAVHVAPTPPRLVTGRGRAGRTAGRGHTGSRSGRTP